MKNNITTAILFAVAITVASCGGSKKDDNATINDLKAKIEKEKKDKAANEAQLKKLEADLLRMDSATASAAKVKLVTTMPITMQPFEHYIDLLGRVDADNISYISPRGMGGQVKAIYIREGQFVKRGQLVLKLDDAIVRQQIQAAKKAMDGIKTQLGFAKNIYQRQKNLWDQGIGTEVQLITAKTNVESLENQLVAANEQVKVAVEQLSTANVYSDVSGIADQVKIRVGETFVGATQAGAQIVIVNKSTLKVKVNVPENYLTRLHSGTPVLINIPDANKVNIPSSISLISQSVDANSRGFMAEAKIPSDGTLKPNQTAVMRIKDYSVANTVVIPVNMVQTDEAGKYVFIMVKSSNGKATAHKVPVVIGEVYGDNVEIKGGLKAGDELITEGYQSLYEGQAISK
ncbi:MAG: efflux RND transporter periplasmic adaptor subunit [Ferruginibacter sp.]|nr:efflux RND transporter periplasmic adaptor subunit [Ferruginibacter sp.]